MLQSVLRVRSSLFKIERREKIEDMSKKQKKKKERKKLREVMKKT